MNDGGGRKRRNREAPIGGLTTDEQEQEFDYEPLDN